MSATLHPIDDTTVDDVVYTAAALFGLDELKGVSRARPVVTARQIAMYVARKVTSASYPEIAASFNRDHSTVMYAVKQVKRRLESDAVLRQRVTRLVAAVEEAR